MLSVKSLQLCLTLCYPMDCSPKGSSIHGILQARILEWVAISSTRASSWARIKPVSLTSPAFPDGFFTTRCHHYYYPKTTDISWKWIKNDKWPHRKIKKGYEQAVYKRGNQDTHYIYKKMSTYTSNQENATDK